MRVTVAVDLGSLCRDVRPRDAYELLACPKRALTASADRITVAASQQHEL